MKSISDFKIGQLVGSEKQSRVTDDLEFSPEQEAILNTIFNSLVDAKPQAKALYSKDPAGAIGWKKSLGVAIIKSGLKRRQIHAGIEKAIHDPMPFFPSVGQFVDWCKSHSGIDDAMFERLFSQTVNRKWKDDLAFHAYTKLDAFIFRSADAEMARVIFKNALKLAMDEIDSGLVVMAPPEDQKELEVLPSSKQTRDAAMQSCWAAIGKNGPE